MSTDLADLISKSVSKEELEAEKVKESEFPTDKPLMIEGDIFQVSLKDKIHLKSDR